MRRTLGSMAPFALAPSPIRPSSAMTLASPSRHPRRCCMFVRRLLLLPLLFLAPIAALPQKSDKPDDKKQPDKKPADPLVESGTYAGLKPRSIGPALFSGRVTSLAINPKDRSHYFVG